MSIELVMPSNHLILCCPLLFLSSIFPSIRVFSHESVLHIRWPKYWSFSISVSPSNEYSGLISFRMDWLDLCAVQQILKSVLQHHSSKTSVPQHSAFFIFQLSHPYMTTGITKALIRWMFVVKVMSLLFNMLSKLVITFLPRSMCLLISWLHMRWPKYWSFSFSIIPSKEHPGLISFRMDWLDLLAVQMTLKSLLQHHSSKANSLVLSFLHSPTLTSIHDYWKNHSLD